MRVSNSYSFSHSAATEDRRFVLMFKPVLGIEEMDNSGVLIANIDGGIKIIPDQNINFRVMVFETTGKCVHSGEINGMEGCEIQLNKGVYLIQLLSSQSILTKKVIIN